MFDDVGIATLAHLFIKKALLPLEVVIATPVWHELFRLADQFFKLFQTFALLNLVHSLSLEEFDFLSDLLEKLLHENRCFLLDEIRVDAIDSIEIILIRSEG